jgi:hypothetical protein
VHPAVQLPPPRPPLPGWMTRFRVARAGGEVLLQLAHVDADCRCVRRVLPEWTPHGVSFLPTVFRRESRCPASRGVPPGTENSPPGALPGETRCPQAPPPAPQYPPPPLGRAAGAWDAVQALPEETARLMPHRGRDVHCAGQATMVPSKSRRRHFLQKRDAPSPLEGRPVSRKALQCWAGNHFACEGGVTRAKAVRVMDIRARKPQRYWKPKGQFPGPLIWQATSHSQARVHAITLVHERGCHHGTSACDNHRMEISTFLWRRSSLRHARAMQQ